MGNISRCINTINLIALSSLLFIVTIIILINERPGGFAPFSFPYFEQENKETVSVVSFYENQNRFYN